MPRGSARRETARQPASQRASEPAAGLDRGVARVGERSEDGRVDGPPNPFRG